MKKRALCALVSLALCVTLAGQAAAAESSVSFVVNGITLAADVPNRVEARTTYVSYWPIVSALYPNATAEWVNGQAEVKADGLTLHIKPGAQYVEANGRYLYVPDGVKCEGYSIMVPIRTLCQALGAGVEWDGTQSTIQITSGSGPILSGEQAYQADVVYWLSRIIYAESGNQPLDGKIAVGWSRTPRRTGGSHCSGDRSGRSAGRRPAQCAHFECRGPAILLPPPGRR